MRIYDNQSLPKANDFIPIAFDFLQLHGTMRKPNLVYTEDTFHGEAPLQGTEEAKKLLDAEATREAPSSSKSSLNVS